MIKRHLNSTLLALILGELTTEGSIHGTGLCSESQNQGIHRERGVDGGINLEKLTPFAFFLSFFLWVAFNTVNLHPLQQVPTMHCKIILFYFIKPPSNYQNHEFFGDFQTIYIIYTCVYKLMEPTDNIEMITIH